MRIINRFRGHFTWVFIKAAFPVFISLLLVSNSLAATPSQAGVSWDYKLLGPLNSAQDPETGLTIVITGSGSFDVLQKVIGGGGSYTILDASGTAVESGTWKAEKFDSFTPMVPGNSPGEGGHLELEALFHNPETHTSRSMHVVIQCSMWEPIVEPNGYPWPADFVEVGPYTIHRTGAVMFNLNQ